MPVNFSLHYCSTFTLYKIKKKKIRRGGEKKAKTEETLKLNYVSVNQARKRKKLKHYHWNTACTSPLSSPSQPSQPKGIQQQSKAAEPSVLVFSSHTALAAEALCTLLEGSHPQGEAALGTAGALHTPAPTAALPCPRGASLLLSSSQAAEEQRSAALLCPRGIVFLPKPASTPARLLFFMSHLMFIVSQSIALKLPLSSCWNCPSTCTSSCLQLPPEGLLPTLLSGTRDSPQGMAGAV